MRIALPHLPHLPRAGRVALDDPDRTLDRAEAVAVIAAGCAAIAGCLVWLF